MQFGQVVRYPYLLPENSKEILHNPNSPTMNIMREGGSGTVETCGGGMTDGMVSLLDVGKVGGNRCGMSSCVSTFTGGNLVAGGMGYGRNGTESEIEVGVGTRWTTPTGTDVGG